MILYYILLIAMTMLGAVASFFLKRASGHDNICGYLFDANLYCKFRSNGVSFPK